MILELFQEIGNELADIEEIQMIDLDKGQLETPERYEALLTPAILVNFEQGIDWQELARGHQTGTALVTLKIAVILPQATYVKPAPVSQAQASLLEVLAIENTVHNRFALTGATRTATKSYNAAGYFITEHTYAIAYKYAPEDRYTSIPRPPLEAVKTIIKPIPV